MGLQTNSDLPPTLWDQLLVLLQGLTRFIVLSVCRGLALPRLPPILLHVPERPISSWPLVSCPCLLLCPLKSLLGYSGTTQRTDPQSQEAGVLIPVLPHHCAMLGKALGHSEYWFLHL